MNQSPPVDEFDVAHIQALRAAYALKQKQDEQKYISLPEAITEAAFHEALGCLPPEDFQRVPGSSSFKMCEYYFGQVTSIYVRIGADYFTFRDMVSLTHEEILLKVAQSASNNKSTAFGVGSNREISAPPGAQHE